MKVVDVINKALLILADDNLKNFVLGVTPNDTQYTSDKELLLISYNNALETAINYLPIVIEETFKSEGGEVKYSKFKRPPYKILNVKTKGVLQTSDIYPTHIKTEGEITVTYSYIPFALDFEEEFSYQNTALTDTTFTFGVLSEYLLYKGRYEESNAYFEKFINGLKNLQLNKKVKKLGCREWF